MLACGIPTVWEGDKHFPNKKIVIVSVPGAFTPTCTANHIPPFVSKYNELKAKGVDEVLVISANDAFVLSAWGKALGAADKIIFASDGNSEFSKQIGFDLDLTSKGFGVRTSRYALIVDNGKVTYAEQDTSGVDKSSVDAVLAKL